jgi:glutathione synthase/RimK-type ligase-like ATP-grasp enzyme
MKRADWRVTFVDRTPFPVRITAPPGSALDFRAVDADACRYEVRELPSDVDRSCAAYLDFFGLRFAAFDFAEAPDASLWFLEANPSGQWGWLEQLAGIDVTGALVHALLRRL